MNTRFNDIGREPDLQMARSQDLRVYYISSIKYSRKSEEGEIHF